MPNFDAISTTVVHFDDPCLPGAFVVQSLSETLLCFIVEYLEPDSNIPVTNGLMHFWAETMSFCQLL